MSVVSVSINEAMLEAIDRLQAEAGFSGRSEVIRTALRMLLEENKKHTELKGRLECVILVIHDHKSCTDVIDLQHKFSDLISTHVHNAVEGGKCLEIFILKGEADEVKQMYGEFQRNKRIGYAKLIVT
jgi:CopG family nickel-responsive transcriptional regulator